MRKIQWQIAISDDEKLVSLENANGFPKDSLESQLLIIGILENLKQKHLDIIKTLYQKTFK